MTYGFVYKIHHKPSVRCVYISMCHYPHAIYRLDYVWGIQFSVSSGMSKLCHSSLIKAKLQLCAVISVDCNVKLCLGQ